MWVWSDCPTWAPLHQLHVHVVLLPSPAPWGCNPELSCLWVVTRAVSKVYTQHLLHAPGLICRRLAKASPQPRLHACPMLSCLSALPSLALQGPLLHTAPPPASLCPEIVPLVWLLHLPSLFIVPMVSGPVCLMLPVKSLSAHNLQGLHSLQGPHNFSGPTQPLDPPFSSLPDHSL